jgi:hypothetical protein
VVLLRKGRTTGRRRSVRAAPAHAGWKELLPASGGAVNRIVIDAGGTRYVVTSGGIYKSADGGNNWVSAQGNLPTTSITPIASDPVAVGWLGALKESSGQVGDARVGVEQVCHSR